MLHGKKDDLSDLLLEGLNSGDFTGLHAECLTDTWIGANRYRHWINSNTASLS